MSFSDTELRKKLGLHSAELMKRRSGRTTDMILKAVAQVMEGNSVYFTAYRPRLTQMICEQAADYVQKLGGDTTLVKRLPPNGDGAGLVYADHFHGDSEDDNF